MTGPGLGYHVELSADVRLAAEICRAGDLAGWQAAAAAAAIAENCPHWTLGLCGGFVGPVLQLCGFETCGINFSGPSSCGKTLAQQLGVSVWTSPRASSGGLLKPVRFTENSVELLARQSNGCVLGLDELALIDGKTLSQVIYGLASGAGKARMTVGLKLRPTITWATFILLSCERTLEHKIRGDGGRWLGGLPVRFPDIDCSDVNRRVPPATIAAVKGVLQHHGQAGRVFIRRFIDAGHRETSEALRERVNELAVQLAGEDATGSRARAALPFAMLEVCGGLARDLKVLPPNIRIARAIEWAWNGFETSMGALALKPEEQAEAHLRRWIAERRTITIKNLDPARDDPVNNRDAVGWFDSKAVYLPVDRIAEACGGGLSENAIGRMLAARNLLAKHKTGRWTVEYVPKIGYVPCYALKFSEFGEAPAFSSDEEPG
jgi:hypothetical protein